MGDYMSRVKSIFGTAEAARLAGLTKRQLDHWDRTGLFKPCIPAFGRGTVRQYSFTDIVQLRVARRLLDLGLSPRRLRLSLECLRENFPARNLTEFSLVTDGKDVYLSSDSSFVVSLLTNGQLVWAVRLEDPTLEDPEPLRDSEDNRASGH